MLLNLVAARLSDSQFLFSLLVSVAAMASVLTVAMPLVLPADNLSRRMKAVSTERKRLRERERERLANERKGLREKPKTYMLRVVERLNLRKWLGSDTAPSQLAAAGFRGRKAEIAFLFFRLVSPGAMLLVSIVYLFVILNLDWPLLWKIGAVLAATYLGAKGPDLYISNATQKRRLSLRRAFPNTLDLLLICVEAGMSIEHAIRKVGNEIGAESVPMAEELSLTAAELSYLSDRKQAYENLAARTGTEHIKAVTAALIQAEQYGTPMGQALRVLAQESREARMTEAEKKAASLPPKLTVPMIIFFLPVLFAVIGTPAIIQISAISK